MGRKGDETKRLILEKSYPLFVEKGFKEVTMEDIRHFAGLSRGGLYRHYGSTEQIFCAIIDGLLAAQEDEFISKMDQGISAVTILDEAFERYRKEMLDSDASLSVAIYEYFSCRRSPSGKNAIELQYNASVAMWKRLLNYGMDRKEFCIVDPEGVVNLILFAYQGVRMYSRLMPIGEPVPSGILQQIRSLIIP